MFPEPKAPAVTMEWPEELVTAVQVLGARLLHSPFFPRWMVNQYSALHLITVRKLTSSSWDITVADGLGNSVHSVFDKKRGFVVS